MGRLFGTDGIRGIAGKEPITRDTAFRVGRAAARYCAENGKLLTVLIGRDTRISGEPLQEALAAGVCSKGGEALIPGVIPTPGAAFLTRDLGAGAGVVISASHNPYEYNGFKVISSEGFKLSDEDEDRLEGYILSDKGLYSPPAPDLNRIQRLPGSNERYTAFLEDSVSGLRLDGMRLVLDCANGAAYRVAPVLFSRLGADVEAMYTTPDGRNINRDCGSQHPEALCSRVVEAKADAGLAFDGDADRLIAVDENGRVLTGDQLLVICAKMLKEKGELDNNVLVSTVMSNMGLDIALKELDIRHLTSRVGDRYVLKEMLACGAVLGGEDSGHIVFLRNQTTGDGLMSGLQLLRAVREWGRPLSQLGSLMRPLPQILMNVTVRIKPDINSILQIRQSIERVERELGERGRVLVRYSGTEPVCRIMVEGEERDVIKAHASRIAGVIADCLN